MSERRDHPVSTLPEGGLTAYVNRERADHRRLANGWCSCDRPLCPERYLLDHIDNLVAAYELKVQDLARETARNAERVSSSIADSAPWHDAALSAWHAWDRFSTARTPIEQADAIGDLADAMSNLATWLPGYDDRTGRISDPDEEVQ